MGFGAQIDGVGKIYLANIHKIGFGLTWEQLWLAFVMQEKYSKQWLTDKKEWVKI